MRCLQDTARVVLALWLALAPVKAWAGSMMLLGAGSAGAAAPAFSITNTDTKTDNGVGGTSITYTTGGAASGSAPNIGVANVNRIVVVGIGLRWTGGTPTVSSVSIGGNAANHCSGSFAGFTGASGGFSDIWYLAVPAGTTASVAAIYSGGSSASAIAVYSVIPTVGTPDNGQAGTITGTSVSNSPALTVVAGGGFVAMGYDQGTATMAWTTPTNIVNDAGTGLTIPGGRTASYAHDVLDTGSVTATFTSSSSTNLALSVCSWH